MKDRESNKGWMRNVWAESKTPTDYTTAMTGTVLFTIANAINDLTHIPYSRYKPNIRLEMKLPRGNFFGREIMKWILIIFLFIAQCGITDEKTACYQKKEETQIMGCEGAIQLNAFYIERVEKLRSENDEIKLRNALLTQELFLNLSVVFCARDYQKDRECKKKSSFLPGYGVPR